jgi:hypothetical protein
VTAPSFSGYEVTEAFGSCLECVPGLTTEINSVWFTFAAANNGSLEFTLDPLVDGDDLDCALFDLASGKDCNSKAIVSCNLRSFIVNGGQTGLSSLGTGTAKSWGVILGRLLKRHLTLL